MVIGVLEVRYHVMTGAERDRRRMARSIVDKLRAQKSYSVSEVGDPNDARAVVVGVTWVGRSAADADAALDQALQILERADAVVVGVERELIHWRSID